MKTEGFDALMRRLNNIGGDVEASAEKGMLAAALKASGEAKLLCPVDEGILRNSIQAGVEKDKGRTVGFVKTNVYYAPYVEFGTGQRGKGSPSPPKWDGSLNYREDWAGMPAQPFLFPAINNNRPQLAKIVMDQVKKDIKKQLLGGGE
ncbi:HK97-gp10 family putative phage morphogenesis protein [Paenibacillus sp. FSL H3-0333]|uniref:HK97-gp10 family putative phage morphogenesis protein n=1 Tax=Paenibacillus sp. FSL H3-0333 TaxID=2921373 RepID=UPI0030FD14C4